MCAIFASCIAGPLIESKPSKSVAEKVEKPKVTEEDTTITEDERKFLREIEEKYNIKNDEEDEDDDEQTVVENNDNSSKIPQAPLPAVIAIEIVNDNTTEGKGKRTIDANLGYGYKTNNGYYYSQFGKPEQKAKFMIYPYSQHDIPAPNKFKYHTQIYSNKAKGEKTIVEIQPSKAFQLVPINQHEQQEGPGSYKVDGSVSHIRTQYEQVQSVETPPPPQYQTQEELYSPEREKFPTLYTTFNGGQLSGLSGHFPIVMPNYYVSPSQVLRHPQFQGFDIPHQEQEQVLPQQKNIIPVLILRIPSSHIQNPTAEFFPKLPRNNPYAMTLNNINLQGLLNQYLSSVQPHYEPQAPQVDNSVLRYTQPAPYYEHEQLYTVPTVNPIQYSTHYIQPNQQQYIQQQNDEEGQSVRYVVPHPSPSPETHQTISHMQLSQVYGPPNHHQPSPAYEQTEEENLPFSENYPDNSHTRVVYNPHYQGAESSQSAVHAVTTQLVNPYPSPTPAAAKASPFVLRRPSIMHKYHSVIPATQEHTYEKVQVGEEQQLTKTTHQLPYNYHAHPYPKRQVKTADTTTKKTTHNRRLMTAVKTSA